MNATFAKFILDFLKLAPRYFITLGVAAAFLLFGPERITKFIGVDDFTQNNRPIIGVVFILATVLLIVTIVTEVINKFRANRKRQGNIADAKIHMIERLNSLTEDEKQILRFYIANQTRSNTLRIDDGIVQGLVSSGIIFRSANMGNALEGFSHNIREFAWDYLNKNQHVLRGSTNSYRTDKKQRRW